MIDTCFPPSHQVIVGGGLAPTVWQRTSISFPEDTGSFLFKIVTDVGPTVKRKDVLFVKVLTSKQLKLRRTHYFIAD